MQRICIILESRHRQLYLRASLESEASRSAILCTSDLLSIPNYVIKKGRPHGHRYGKTKEKRDHHIAHNLRKRCIKRGFEGIHDRFQTDSNFVNPKSTLFELKKSASRWMSLRKKIPDIICQKQKTFDTKRTSGSLPTHPGAMDR